MPVITEISAQKNNSERCNIYVDGVFYCALRLETVMIYRLKAGMEAETSFLDGIQFENEKAQALDKALTHISGSMKTEREIRLFLERKGYTEPVAEYCVGKMKEYGYIDDAAYCRMYTESCRGKKGVRLIRSELKAKGADPEAAEAALSAVDWEQEAAQAVFRKYMRSKPYTQENLRRAVRHLLSRGFDPDIVQEAVRKAAEAE